MGMKPLRPCRHPGCCCAAHQMPPEMRWGNRQEDRRSRESKAWRRMYQTDAWKQLRVSQLLAEPFCRECARQGRRTPATDVDHIRDHKGDWTLFTSDPNLQSLCHSCHSRKTARELWQNQRGKCGFDRRTDIDRLSSAEEDAAVGRGVNSLTNVAGRSEVWRKIKLLELLDMVQQDLRLTIQDSYMGKYQNSYDNKLLITAIKFYLQALEKDQFIEPDFICDIDVDEQERWLQGQCVTTADMTPPREIREANTGTHVFLDIRITPIDAIEDVHMNIYL